MSIYESPASANFSINVMRSASDARTDDQIIIKPDGQFFNLTYNNKDEKITHRQSFNTTEVFAYMRDFITLISSDEKPDRKSVV